MKNIRKRLNYKRQQLLAKFDHFISKILTLERQITRGATGLKEMTFYHFSSSKRFAVMNSENQLIRLGCYWEVLHEYDNGSLVRRIPSRHNLLKGERLATQEEIAQYQEERRELEKKRNVLFEDSSGFSFGYCD